MNEETARALIAALNRLSVSIDRLTLPDNKLGENPDAVIDWHNRGRRYPAARGGRGAGMQLWSGPWT